MAQYPYPSPGAVGRRMSPIAYPRPFSDLSDRYNNLPETNAALTQSVLRKAQGELSIPAQQAIQNTAAKFAVGGGMPGSNAIPGTLGFNRTLRDIGRSVEDVQSQAVAQYATLAPTISQTQTVSPELQTGINLQNAMSAASPNPTQAAQYAQSLFDYYTKKMSGKGFNWRQQSVGTGGTPLVRTQTYWQDEAGNTADFFPGWG